MSSAARGGAQKRSRQAEAPSSGAYSQGLVGDELKNGEGSRTLTSIFRTLGELPSAIFEILPTLRQSDSPLRLLELGLDADKETQTKLLRLLEKVVPTDEGPRESNSPPAKRARLHETPDFFAPRPLQVDRRVVLSMRRGFHVPLTLFTAHAIKAVTERWTVLKLEERCSVVHDDDVNCVVTSTWPDETAMSPGEWREAYGYFLATLPQLLPEAGVERFRQHYEFLAGQERFAAWFPTILRFDISVRSRYFDDLACVPFYPGSEAYTREFRDWCQDDLDEKILLNREALVGGGNGQSGRAGSPFRQNSSPDPACAGPLCVVCARYGHRAAACTYSQLLGGRPTFVTFSHGRLLDPAGKDICYRWNLGSPGPCKDRRCSYSDLGRHVCSLCGSDDHNAVAAWCLSDERY